MADDSMALDTAPLNGGITNNNNNASPPAIFDSVHFHVPSCIPPHHRSQLRTLLTLNGAVEHPSLSPDGLTHVVTPTPNFESSVLLPSQIHLVTPQWVERSIILGSPQPPQFYSPDPAMLFSGVVACSTGLGESDTLVLSAGVLSMGGQWRVGLTKDVTHLFAVGPAGGEEGEEGSKYATAMHFKHATGAFPFPLSFFLTYYILTQLTPLTHQV